MAKKTAVTSKHKTVALAERHARKLARETGGSVQIIRRNASGKFSKHGKHYTFVVTPPKKGGDVIPKPPKPPAPPKYKGEMAIKTEYRGKSAKGGDHPLMTDVRIYVRRKRTAEQIKQAVSDHFKKGTPVPNWLSVQTYTWNHGAGERVGDRDDFQFIIDSGAPFDPDDLELLGVD